MARKFRIEFIDQLPISIGERIQSYVEAVEESSEQIFREVGIEYSETKKNELLLLCAVIRLREILQTQTSLLNTINNYAEKKDVDQLYVGRMELSRRSDIYRKTNSLFVFFEQVLALNGHAQILQIRTPKELLEYLKDES